MIYKDKRSGLTAKKLRKLLDYDPATGVFTWRGSSGSGMNMRPKGQFAGTRFVKGWRIEMYNFGFLAHRLAWLYMTGRWPKDQIDHKNGDCWDNSWENLREADNSRNQANRGMRPHNKSGITGVMYGRNGQFNWYAECSIDGVRVLQKWFKTKEAAVAARQAAVRKYHGEFAVLGTKD